MAVQNDRYLWKNSLGDGMNIGDGEYLSSIHNVNNLPPEQHCFENRQMMNMEMNNEKYCNFYLKNSVQHSIKSENIERDMNNSLQYFGKDKHTFDQQQLPFVLNQQHQQDQQGNYLEEQKLINETNLIGNEFSNSLPSGTENLNNNDNHHFPQSNRNNDGNIKRELPNNLQASQSSTNLLDGCMDYNKLMMANESLVVQAQPSQLPSSQQLSSSTNGSTPTSCLSTSSLATSNDSAVQLSHTNQNNADGNIRISTNNSTSEIVINNNNHNSYKILQMFPPWMCGLPMNFNSWSSSATPTNNTPSNTNDQFGLMSYEQLYPYLNNTMNYPKLPPKCDSYSNMDFWMKYFGNKKTIDTIPQLKHKANESRGLSSISKPYSKPKNVRKVATKKDAKCTNCGTSKTTLWRRNNKSEAVCNACGLYFKLHGTVRPITLKKELIQTRKRKIRNSRVDINTPIFPSLSNDARRTLVETPTLYTNANYNVGEMEQYLNCFPETWLTNNYTSQIKSNDLSN
ncbi:hypothetical protein SNEBB_010014 [Seison nebaliae]|nr:hypothetical protein SNEBB_010014 [Seison nebaliae]